ncbi:Thioredoxin H-type [Morella rubra]|uniref:Thioredoxin H-type n=1 Tax=Morella rubra TaxID=262757 RepID=A0A6A1UP16_9ROSI|nr:Thioredoxin H-type [Morella rubra]
MEPIVANMANTYPNVTFLGVNVNSLMSVVDANCAQQMPTFLFLKGGTRVDIVVGANPSQLQQTLGRHTWFAEYTGQRRTVAPYTVAGDIDNKTLLDSRLNYPGRV